MSKPGAKLAEGDGVLLQSLYVTDRVQARACKNAARFEALPASPSAWPAPAPELLRADCFPKRKLKEKLRHPYCSPLLFLSLKTSLRYFLRQTLPAEKLERVALDCHQTTYSFNSQISANPSQPSFHFSFCFWSLTPVLNHSWFTDTYGGVDSFHAVLRSGSLALSDILFELWGLPDPSLCKTHNSLQKIADTVTSFFYIPSPVRSC